MLECTHCGGACEEDSLYCVHCGERLSTDACRKCGSFVPKSVAYCARCGYPTEGTVCAHCGKKNPDEANFCLSCGAELKKGGAKETHAAHETVKSDPVATHAMSGKKKHFALHVTRMFVLPAILACMFISSFFGMFDIYVLDVDADVPVTGFDAVRGIFLIMNPPDAKEVSEDFNEFLRMHDTGDELTKRDECDLIQKYGVLRYSVCKETLTTARTMQIFLWGLTALGNMTISLVFFVITLVHAVQTVRGKCAAPYKHETLPLALAFALTFSFLMTGGLLAGAAWAVLILSCAGLSAITAIKYFAEHMPRPTVLQNVRRAVCAALVVLTACFATSGLVTVEYKPQASESSSANAAVSTSIPASQLYAGMRNELEILLENLGEGAATISAKDLDAALNEMLSTEQLSTRHKQLLTGMFGSPVILCFSDEAVASFGVPVQVVSWLLFFANVIFAFAACGLLFQMLQEESNPGTKRKTLPWSIVLFASACAVLGLAIPYIVMGNSAAGSFLLHMRYGMSGMIITGAILGLCTMAAEIVFGAIKKPSSGVAEISPRESAENAEQAV